MDQPVAPWYVYILLCKDRSLYTGITTHLQRRLAEHNSSNKAARYTRARRPVKLVYAEVLDTRSLASQREYAIKGLCRARKLALIRAGDQSLLDGVINVRSQ